MCMVTLAQRRMTYTAINGWNRLVEEWYRYFLIGFFPNSEESGGDVVGPACVKKGRRVTKIYEKLDSKRQICPSLKIDFKVYLGV